jgi:hypothetical protein
VEYIRLTGNRRVVDDMQHRHGKDEGGKEPVGHIDVRGLALLDGHQEDNGIADPHHGDQDVDRPLELGILLGGGVAQRERHDRRQDHRLPAPEGEGRQLVAEQPRLAGTLYHVIRGRHQRGAAEGEDDGIGVQRAQATEAGPRQIEVELRPYQLCGKDDTEEHAHDAPHHCHDRELPNYLVVVGRVL